MTTAGNAVVETTVAKLFQISTPSTPRSRIIALHVNPTEEKSNARA